MKTYTYSLFYRLFYRFGNIPVTILLLMYFIPAVISIQRSWLYIFPVLITLLMLFLLNRHFIYLYKNMPFKITAYEDRIVAEDYIFSQKKTEMFFSSITEIRGGIFDGKLRGIIVVKDGKNTIAYYSKINDVQSLGTLLLSKVRREIYDAIIEQIGLKKREK